MEKIAKGAHHTLAATIAGALYTGFLICLVVIGLAQMGITGDMLLAICQGRSRNQTISGATAYSAQLPAFTLTTATRCPDLRLCIRGPRISMVPTPSNPTAGR